MVSKYDKQKTVMQNGANFLLYLRYFCLGAFSSGILHVPLGKLINEIKETAC